MHAKLRSNSGEDELIIALESVVVYATDNGFESNICLRGQHWDGDHSFPFSSFINGLWLQADDLATLARHITNWIDLPLDQLVSGKLEGEFSLTRLPNQILRIRFGRLPDEASGLNPAVWISCAAREFRSEFQFITDQSCLNLFAMELRACLQKTHELSA